LDLVITVCDNAKESCPIFLKPVKQVHIGIEDPVSYTDAEPELALARFREVRDSITRPDSGLSEQALSPASKLRNQAFITFLRLFLFSYPFMGDSKPSSVAGVIHSVKRRRIGIAVMNQRQDIYIRKLTR
jgi:hypothetical protein